MAQSFKLKLQKLSDEEFSEIMVNRDLFTGKKLLLLDQEARNRYFSNKEFNGENDVYINPDLTETVVERRNRIYWVTALAGVLLLVALFIVMSRNFFLEKPVELAVTENKTVVKEQEPTLNNESGNLKIEAQNKVVPVEEVKLANPSFTEKEAPNTQSNALQSAENKAIENQGYAESKKATENNQSTQNSTKKQETEKVNNGVKVEEKKTAQQEDSQKSTAKNEVNDHKDQEKNQADKGVEENSPQKKEQQSPPKEVSPTEASKVVSETPHQFKISELSTEHLRQLVKFQNEWAHKQTTVKGVADYYVDGNVAIKFILSQPYSDSVNQYQRRIIPILTGKYWKDLEKELGEKFPRTPMQITFVRFDSEL